MQILILGAGVGVPQKERSSPSFLLRVRKHLFLFDTGPGTLHQLAKASIHINEIEQIFYTHSHLDHVLELPFFLFASKYPLQKRRSPLTVNVPSLMKDFVRDFIHLFGEQVEVDYPLHIREVDEWEEDGVRIKTAQMLHREESVGYRVEAEGRSFVYSGDTEYCKEIVELAKGCNLLALECSFPDDMKVEWHLTPTLCARIAKEAAVKKLLLLHLYPVCKGEQIERSCKKVYDGEIIVAEDLQSIRI
jgi:ribonuclease BN (tRNA processing enzyme)